MSAVRHRRWVTNDATIPGGPGADELRSLIAEVDRPLLPGFMTAGYSALGRFIFLAAQARGHRDHWPA